MSFNDASTACRVHLSQMVDLPPVAYENIDFQPTLGEVYLREVTIPTFSTGLLMSGSLQENKFYYQVTVYVPKGSSQPMAVKIADKVADHFARGLKIPRNGLTVEVHKSRVKGGFPSDSWYAVPVEVECLFFA